LAGVLFLEGEDGELVPVALPSETNVGERRSLSDEATMEPRGELVAFEPRSIHTPAQGAALPPSTNHYRAMMLASLAI
jgi:hypothetical protein